MARVIPVPFAAFDFVEDRRNDRKGGQEHGERDAPPVLPIVAKTSPVFLRMSAQEHPSAVSIVNRRVAPSRLWPPVGKKDQTTHDASQMLVRVIGHVVILAPQTNRLSRTGARATETTGPP